jgi:hypothetical protein
MSTSGFNHNFEAESGAATAEYDTYVLLPTTTNGLGAPVDGTQANVTTTGAAGSYTYVATLDSYVFDMWLPSNWVLRGIAYLVDSSGYPCRLSTGIGGENKAALTARGWTSNGTTADSGGNIRVTSDGTAGYASSS